MLHVNFQNYMCVINNFTQQGSIKYIKSDSKDLK